MHTLICFVGPVIASVAWAERERHGSGGRSLSDVAFARVAAVRRGPREWPARRGAASTIGTQRVSVLRRQHTVGSSSDRRLETPPTRDGYPEDSPCALGASTLPFPCAAHC